MHARAHTHSSWGFSTPHLCPGVPSVGGLSENADTLWKKNTGVHDMHTIEIFLPAHLWRRRRAKIIIPLKDGANKAQRHSTSTSRLNSKPKVQENARCYTRTSALKHQNLKEQVFPIVGFVPILLLSLSPTPLPLPIK